jgi:hypothetical protein
LLSLSDLDPSKNKKIVSLILFSKPSTIIANVSHSHHNWKRKCIQTGKCKGIWRKTATSKSKLIYEQLFYLCCYEQLYLYLLFFTHILSTLCKRGVGNNDWTLPLFFNKKRIKLSNSMTIPHP